MRPDRVIGGVFIYSSPENALAFYLYALKLVEKYGKFARVELNGNQVTVLLQVDSVGEAVAEALVAQINAEAPSFD